MMIGKNMNDIVLDVNTRIKTFLQNDSLIHLSMDKRRQPKQELERRCNTEEESIIVNRFLYYVWSNLGIHSDEFYSLVTPENFLEIKSYPIDYKKLTDSCSCSITATPKYNIIVPVKNRNEHLDSFIQNCIRVLSERKEWGVTVVFQEETEENYKEYSTRQYPPQLNINFINIQHDSWFSSHYGDNMNRSLCYNLVSLIVPCEYQINHDVDLIFKENFLDNIEAKTNNPNFKWLQPYRGSRVIMMNQTESNDIKLALQNGVQFEFPDKQIRLNKTPLSGGAPGGSVVVKHSDFVKMGGYDPELVWGYAPEDMLFWYKLEAYNGCITEGKKLHPFCSDDVFSHETDVELYHMYHPPTPVDKKIPFFSTFIATWLLNKGDRFLLDQWLNVSRMKMMTK